MTCPLSHCKKLGILSSMIQSSSIVHIPFIHIVSGTGGFHWHVWIQFDHDTTVMSFHVLYSLLIHAVFFTAHVFSAKFEIHSLCHVNVILNSFVVLFHHTILEFHTNMFPLYSMSEFVNAVVCIQWLSSHTTLIVHVCHKVTISGAEILQFGLFHSCAITSITFE